jgi:hypothetical protein
MAMPFIPPMLARRLEDPSRLADPRYIAEPKLDGQRVHVHVRGGRTVACYLRPGRDLLRHAGMTWLREVSWPVDVGIFDGEAVAGDGNEGIQAVFEARNCCASPWPSPAFDLLEVQRPGRSGFLQGWSDFSHAA